MTHPMFPEGTPPEVKRMALEYVVSEYTESCSAPPGPDPKGTPGVDLSLCDSYPGPVCLVDASIHRLIILVLTLTLTDASLG